MKHPQKHRNVVAQCIKDGKQEVILSGQLHNVNDIAMEMGIESHNADKYRKEHADMETEDHSRDIEDSGDGISESEE